MARFWKQNGKEQKYLETLFHSNEVHCDMRPSIVQNKYDIFKKFSSSVFRKHWQLTKKLFETEGISVTKHFNFPLYDNKINFS